MPLTANRLIQRALHLIGAFGEGQTPTADAMNDGLDTLNDMVDGWAIDGLAIRALRRDEFPMIAGQGTYFLGPGGDFDAPKPAYIDNIGYIVGETEYMVHPMDAGEWASINNRGLKSRPQRAYHTESPDGLKFEIHYWPVPDIDMLAAIYLPVVVTRFINLTTQYTFPGGFPRALRYNLAVELCPEYELPLDPVVAAKAAEYMADVRRVNIKPRVIAPDGPNAAIQGGGYDIYTDSY